MSLQKTFVKKSLNLSPIDHQRLSHLCGLYDQNLRQIEEVLGVEIYNRGHRFEIHGSNKTATEQCIKVLTYLYEQTSNNNLLTPKQIHFCLQNYQNLTEEDTVIQETTLLRTRHTLVKLQSLNQQKYINNISTHSINFGIGPAGTGKTYLAVACAVYALESEKIQRIVLVRPAIEAGERLGFLPGDLNQKVDPYFRPLYDALYEMLGFEQVHQLIEKNIIEIAPLAYMRGRTLSDAFIILDESQNTTREQMKMFLTRIGFGSKVVITGDTTQIDLPNKMHSGLHQAIALLSSIADISFTYFETKDVVRHALVQKIIQAYESVENASS